MTVNEAKKILQAANLTPPERTAMEFLILELECTYESLPDEIWRDIVDYGGKYQVSNYARISSLCRGKTKLIKPDIVHTGYLRVTFYKNGKTKNHYVHVLVAQAFIPNPDNKRQVNHLDGDKTNNHVSNLEWATPAENIHHAFAMGLRKSGYEHLRAKFTPEQVREIRRDCVPGDSELGFKPFAKKFNVTPKIISDAYYCKSYQNVD